MATWVAKARSCLTRAAAFPSNARNHCGFPPVADPDAWLCPASKGQSQPKATAPALAPQRVHEGCGATAPKAAACLGITMVSLLQTVSRPRGQWDLPGHPTPLPGAGVRVGAGPWQACSEMPWLEINPAATPGTRVPLAYAPQEHWAAAESCSLTVWLLIKDGKTNHDGL